MFNFDDFYANKQAETKKFMDEFHANEQRKKEELKKMMDEFHADEQRKQEEARKFFNDFYATGQLPSFEDLKIQKQPEPYNWFEKQTVQNPSTSPFVNYTTLSDSIAYPISNKLNKPSTEEKKVSAPNYKTAENLYNTLVKPHINTKYFSTLKNIKYLKETAIPDAEFWFKDAKNSSADDYNSNPDGTTTWRHRSSRRSDISSKKQKLNELTKELKQRQREEKQYSISVATYTAQLNVHVANFYSQAENLGCVEFLDPYDYSSYKKGTLDVYNVFTEGKNLLKKLPREKRCCEYGYNQYAVRQEHGLYMEHLDRTDYYCKVCNSRLF